jgi:hypothetical protein
MIINYNKVFLKLLLFMLKIKYKINKTQ